MFLVSQVSGLVENFNIGIFSDIGNVINVKLCMVILHIELYLDIISRSQQCPTVSTGKFFVLI